MYVCGSRKSLGHQEEIGCNPKKPENHFNINQKRNNFVETDTQSLHVIHLNCKFNVKLSDLNFSDKLIFTSTYYFRR